MTTAATTPESPQVDVTAILAAAHEQVVSGVAKAAQERLVSALGYSLAQAAERIVGEYVRDHLEPAVKLQLSQAHDELVRGVVEAAVVAAAMVGEKLRDSLVAQATKVLADQYKVGQLADKIFGKGY